MNKLILATLICFAGAGAANAAPVFTENFETGTLGTTTAATNVLTANGATYQPCCGTDPAYTNFFAAFDPGESGAGLLSYAFGTIAGRVYTVAFDLGALGSASETLTVTAGATSVVYNPFADNELDSTFSPTSFTFLGSGGLTTLSFASQGVDGVDAIVDNISVTAVPEPATWAMMIGGFALVGGALRRRSGKLATA